jgi:lysozyme
MYRPTAKQIGLAAAGLSAAAILALPGIIREEAMPAVGYRDAVGIPTECAGHTEGAVVGRVSTIDRCLTLAAADADRFDKRIRPCIKVPISDVTRSAFISFSFNVGSTAFCTSTMARRLNAGDVRGACAQFDKWVYAKGRKLPGLVSRRARERAQCERGIA